MTRCYEQLAAALAENQPFVLALISGRKFQPTVHQRQGVFSPTAKSVGTLRGGGFGALPGVARGALVVINSRHGHVGRRADRPGAGGKAPLWQRPGEGGDAGRRFAAGGGVDDDSRE